ncbi:MAG: tetratricopeptide repeat protein [Gemmatimonas sp.]|nr:tetratricopeptide repeat protein [Gemmatimonas sp.]
MPRFVPSALLTATVALSAAGCAAAGAGVELGGDLGGRYLVMIPALEGPSGDVVANELRALVTEMSTHAAIADGEVRRVMGEYDLAELNEVTARQLAQQIEAQLVSWGSVQEGGAGLQADMVFVDTRSGDEITVEGASGGTPQELAASIFGTFSESVEGIRQAAFCNDYLSSNQYDRALETCEGALAIVPNSTSALYGKATALLNIEGREAEALETYEQLLEVDPTHQDALLGAGLAASRLDRQDNAMDFYNRYMEINPGNVDVRMTLANDIAETGDYISAYRLLEPAVQDAADNTEFQGYLFQMATAAGQRAQEQADSTTARQIFMVALQAYEAGYSNGDEVPAAALRQAIAVNNELGRTDEAIAIAEDATQRFPDDAQVWSQYATVLSSAGQHAEAINALNRVIEINPDQENVYVRRAQAYLENDQREQAFADLDRAAEAGGAETVAQVLYGIGARAIEAENFAEAASVLEPAHNYAAADGRSDIAFYWGYALYKQGEAIARANTQGNAEQAERALEFFRDAIPRLESSNHGQAAQVLDGAQQYITNQEAVIRAANR